jgi:hypothetical protein
MEKMHQTWYNIHVELPESVIRKEDVLVYVRAGRNSGNEITISYRFKNTIRVSFGLRIDTVFLVCTLSMRSRL